MSLPGVERWSWASISARAGAVSIIAFALREQAVLTVTVGGQLDASAKFVDPNADMRIRPPYRGCETQAAVDRDIYAGQGQSGRRFRRTPGTPQAERIAEPLASIVSFLSMLRRLMDDDGGAWCR
jgi:hypothetical protein